VSDFPYDEAFSRNLGWVAPWEQQALRAKRVAIAGMGGVGGVHLLTLARFGVGGASIADLDRFEFANFNRQAGANTGTVGRPKNEVMAEMALAINPGMSIRRFDQGIDESNIDAFLAGADVFIDGFDFFVLGIRRKVFARCAELGIPALTAAPIGMGTGFLAFIPGHMGFEEYFRLEGQPEISQYIRFLVGLVPRGLHRAYLVDPTRVDLANKRGPSTGASCQLCAGVVAVNAVKLMLGRGGVLPAPWHHHYDAYVNRLALTRLRWGNAGPLQRLKIAVARRAIAAMPPAAARPAEFSPRPPVEEILNLARWAPSGDNVQPWRFEVLDDDSVLVHLSARRGDSIYEYRNGEPGLLAGGGLLECLDIAASGRGRRMSWRLEGGDGTDPVHRIRVRFQTAAVDADPLLGQLTLRSVDRRPYRMRHLTGAEKLALEQAVSPTLLLGWHESAVERLRLAWLGAFATDIRLRAPEAHQVHQRIIDFQRAHSPDGIPAGAVGLDRATLLVMRWALQAWPRQRLLNRLGGTWAVAAQLDLWPGLASGAFFTMRLAASAPSLSARVDAMLQAGRAIQRFWLQASRLGLAMQPTLATLAFAHYGAVDAPFTADVEVRRKARALAGTFRRTLDNDPDSFVFMGRIGETRPRLPLQRSTRRSLDQMGIARRMS